VSTIVKSTKEVSDDARLWWRIVRGTWRGTCVLARNAYIDGRVFYGQAKTRAQVSYRRWQREREFSPEEINSVEVDEVPRRRRRLFRAQYLCFACSRKYSSAYGLNKHFGAVHGTETLPKDRPASGTTIIRGRGATRRVRVRPRRAATTTAAPTTTSTRSANPMNSEAAQALKAAWGKLKEARPKKLSEIRDDMIGVEQAMGAYATEAIEEYRNHLVRNLGFDPVTVQNLSRAAQLGEEMGKHFSAVIAVIEEVYAADIAAAKRRAGGARPSDSTLTS